MKCQELLRLHLPDSCSLPPELVSNRVILRTKMIAYQQVKPLRLLNNTISCFNKLLIKEFYHKLICN